jgi:outer membrane protein assembly factor BamB
MMLALLLVAAPQLVLVPEGGAGAQCEARERLAAALALAPEARVLRAPRAEGEALSAAVTRLGATRGADATYGPDVGAAVEVVEGGRSRRAQARGGVGAALGAALRQAWGDGLPDDAGFIGAPSPAALAAACAGQEAAFAEAGAAVAPRLAELATPPARLRQGSLLERWAWARRAAAEDGRCREPLPVLKAVVYGLEQGNLPPVWRRAPEGAPPTAVTGVAGAWVLFSEGRFTAVDPRSGETIWRRSVTEADPTPVDLGEGRMAWVEAAGLKVLDTATGTAAWSLPQPRLAAEVAVVRDLVVVASDEQVFALDRRDGQVRWSFDGLSTPAAGPAAAKNLVIAPLYSRLVVLDPTDGRLVKEVELSDEITAPLVVAEDGAVWAAVGADELVRVDPVRGQVTFRTAKAYGLDWPPAVVARRLVGLSRGRNQQATLTYVFPERSAVEARPVRGLVPPVLGLADYSGVVHPEERPAAIVARDVNGKELWRARQPQAVRALLAPGDLVVAAVGRRVVVLDRKRGQPLWQADLPAAVVDVRYGPDGGVAVLEDGVLYGLPSPRDPRPRAYLEAARLDLGRCQLQAGDPAGAQASAKEVLERSPGQLDALALTAAAAQARRRPEALASWLAVRLAAPPGDPARAMADAALAELADVRRVLTPSEPQALSGWLTTSPERLVARTSAGLVALDAATGQPVWRAKDPVGGGPGVVLTKQGALRAADGAVVKGLAGATLAGPALFTRPEPKALERRTPEGAVAWRLSLDHPNLRLLAASAQDVVLTSTRADGLTVLVDAGTGARRWMRPLGAPLTAAWPSDGALLALNAEGLLGFDALTGDRRFRLPPPEGAVIHPLPGGWLVVEPARLWVLDPQGRRRFVVARRGPVDAVRVAPDGKRAFTFGDGALEVLELTTGKRLARWEGLTVVDVAAAGAELAVLVSPGVVLMMGGP